MPAPTVDFDGRTYVMTDKETGFVTQAGDVVLISRREVEATLEVMRRRKGDKRFGDYSKKIKAYESLLRQADAN